MSFGGYPPAARPPGQTTKPSVAGLRVRCGASAWVMRGDRTTEYDAIHRGAQKELYVCIQYVCMASAHTERDRGCVATRETEKVLSKERDITTTTVVVK